MATSTIKNQFKDISNDFTSESASYLYAYKVGNLVHLTVKFDAGSYNNGYEITVLSRHVPKTVAVGTAFNYNTGGTIGSIWAQTSDNKLRLFTGSLTSVPWIATICYVSN